MKVENNRQGGLLICARCGKQLKEGLLLPSYDGEICVDCVVKEEMMTLEEELKVEN
ncbi:hypothetical protein ACFLQ1_01355 [Candidatus Auribacterota bacterium]